MASQQTQTQTQTPPSTMRALVLTSTSLPPTVETVPTPTPTPGSAIVRILAANIVSYAREIYDGTRGYPFPTPLIPGGSAIARIVSTGPDAALLAPGALVFVDAIVRARDDPSTTILLGLVAGPSPAAHALMRDAWPHGSYAQYARVPLESCFALDEARLLGAPSPAGGGGLGYTLPDLSFLTTLLVPYAGLRAAGLLPGETVLIAPATGPFGSAAVRVALALGAARVLALGRNPASLRALAALSPRVSAIQIPPDASPAALTTSIQSTAPGPVDVYLDLTPPLAASPPHIPACLTALRPRARVVLMGGLHTDVPLPYGTIMAKSLSIQGCFMYARAEAVALVRLVEAGVLRLGEGEGLRVERFGLEEWEEAWGRAAEGGVGRGVVFVP